MSTHVEATFFHLDLEFLITSVQVKCKHTNSNDIDIIEEQELLFAFRMRVIKVWKRVVFALYKYCQSFVKKSSLSTFQNVCAIGTNGTLFFARKSEK